MPDPASVEVGYWFTTSRDRAEGRGRIDIARTVSPAVFADRLLAGFGVRPPLETWRLSDEELSGWAETLHGGRVHAEPRLLGRPFTADALDVNACYPLVAHRLGWWRPITAAGIRRRDVTGALRRVCEQAARNPTVAVDPKLWARFGPATLVEVDADGERFPVTLDDPLRPDGRMEVVPVFCRGRSLFYAWPDVLAAAVLSGRTPHIVGATRYEPVGHQDLRPRLPVLPGLLLDAEVDPVLALFRRRARAKTAAARAQRSGDHDAERAARVLADELRLVSNALVSGIEYRFDQVWLKSRGVWRRGERPGPWSCLPIAATVTAGARLLLAVLERMFSDLGGLVAYMDTDSALIPASPDGGPLALADHPGVRGLSWAEVDRVLARFSPLCLPRWRVWKVERGRRGEPLQAVVFGPKRHAEFAGSGDDMRLVDATEANLGGTHADPPGMRGRVALPNGYRRWSMAAVRREVDFALGRADNPDAVRPSGPAPWDNPDGPPFPALQRFMVKSPAMAAALPTCLGAKPGTRYIQAQAAHFWRPDLPTPVTLDPGGDLAGWADLGWVDLKSGRPLRVTTDEADPGVLSGEHGVVLVVSLDVKARDWSRPPRHDPVSEIVVTPANVRHVGRVSGLIDADIDGEPGDLAGYRPSYDRQCACGCGQPVSGRRRDARYASGPHRERAKKRRQRAGQTRNDNP